MVLSPLLIQGIEVNLPKTDTTKMSIASEPLVISIDELGEYYINLGEEQLPISLKELKNKAPNKTTTYQTHTNKSFNN